MKPKQFDIQFDNPQGVFTCGNRVSGTVILTLETPMKIKGIKIFFEGRAKSHWSKKQGKSRIRYNAQETYFYKVFNLYEPESGKEHPHGSHAYPFSMELADALPSSFEGTRGHVRYLCKATIDRPWAFDVHVKRAFTVIHHLDLNDIPSAIIPMAGHVTQEVYGCCGSAGSVAVELELNKSGYVPGEPIVYTISVINESSKTVNQVALILKQTVTYTATSDNIWSRGNPKQHPKTQPYYLLYSRNCNFKPKTSKQMHAATIVPSLPPSQLDGCNIIDIKYMIELKVSCADSSLKIIKDILIGTIPVQGYDPSTAQGLGQRAEGGGQATDKDGLPTYDEVSAPPPTYAECVSGRTTIMDTSDDNNTSGDVSWAPTYPYYDWTSHHPQTFGGEPPSVATVGQSEDGDDDTAL